MNIINDIVSNYERKVNIINKLAIYFNKNLLFNKEALNYCIVERGFTKRIIDTFLIGYDSKLANFINKEEIDPEVLCQIGIILKNDDNSYYNKFSNRIIFPVFDLKGNITGFSGRVWKKEDTRSKYINSSLSTVYQKSFSLYGLYQSLEHIIESNLVIVVEGSPDVLTFHQEGVKIAVSACGTSFMESHYLILRQFTNRFIFCFDNDKGGNKAIEKIKKLLENREGIQVGYLQIEGAKDPDEFIQTYGSSTLKESILKLEARL